MWRGKTQGVKAGTGYSGDIKTLVVNVGIGSEGQKSQNSTGAGRVKDNNCLSIRTLVAKGGLRRPWGHCLVTSGMVKA